MGRSSININNFKIEPPVSVTLTLDVSGAYATGDVLADTQAIELQLNDPECTTTGRIERIVILDKNDQGADLDVVFFNSSVSLGTENAAVSISDTDAESIIGTVNVTSYTDLIESQVAFPVMTPIPFDSSDGNVYMGLISRGTPTHASASGMIVKVFYSLDIFG